LNKKVLVIAVVLMAVAMLAVPISAVYATKPMLVQGTILPAGAPTVVQSQPGKSDNLVLEISNTMTWMGSFVGSSATQVHWNVIKYGDEKAPGHHVSGKSLWILDAVFDGKEGTLTIKGDQGIWRIISGTGELANLRGQGIFEIINPTILLMSYEGQVHFDP
jgi:hypothetical protein